MTESDTHKALLHAILADPSDDLPRLAYADWCEEYGYINRANFVRVQLALFHGPRGYKTEQECPRSLRHHWREDRDLYKRTEKECWPNITEELPCWESVFPMMYHGHEQWLWHYERGFIYSVQAQTWATFLRHAETIFRWFPVEWVRIADRDPWQISPHHPVSWFYIRSGEQGYSQDWIVAELWDLLEGGELWGPNNVARGYPSAENAHAALSRACVRYGRRLAGLPDLWR